jgi:hypothetical protein
MDSRYRIKPEVRGGAAGFRAWWVAINGTERRAEIWRGTREALRDAMAAIYGAVYEVKGGSDGRDAGGRGVRDAGVQGVRRGEGD